MRSPGQTSITVRAATPRDMPAIVGIYNWAINQTFATIDSEPLSVEEAAAWWDAHGSQRLTLVAEDDGDVVGWAQLLPWRQRGFEVVEDLVYVDPVYQKKGVGRELLSRAIEAARSTGCRTIVASVAADNTARPEAPPEPRLRDRRDREERRPQVRPLDGHHARPAPDLRARRPAG